MVLFSQNQTGIGVIVRNNNGQVIDWLTQQLNQAYKSIEVEAMAAIRVLEFVAKLGLGWNGS